MRIHVNPTNASSEINKAFATIFDENSGDIKPKVCLTCNRHVYLNEF